ncbi:hypothetical protein O0I10_004761 [Lichtheimia ornata]|uniref:Uncharacterized protein n=1 Tax=Lichtheimia ornata TaxID=688661 RepID=A0AAD7V5N6_9FUNG|nr:uncharacterized protein O0I10_004761 [Lichtheimia ornata]KAJ8659399.1 hypothetical protein O0I10_004761 [Lichtheimia ornata]
MSRLTQTPPIINLNPSHPGPVRVHLDEPFLHRQRSKKARHAIHILGLFGRLELVLKKRESLRALDDRSPAEATLLQKLDGEAEMIKTQIESTWIQLGAKDYETREKYSKDMKLSQLYPRSINNLHKRSAEEYNDENSMQAHYHKIAMYDQLYAHASRINQSLELPNHDYIPYQLVVVYQCLNHVDISFAEYRDKIQKRFEDVRSSITSQQEKGAQNPLLDGELKSWLKDLMTEIVTQVVHAPDTSKMERYKLLNDTVASIHQISNASSSSSND